jgi:hypothetical protein
LSVPVEQMECKETGKNACPTDLLEHFAQKQTGVILRLSDKDS